MDDCKDLSLSTSTSDNLGENGRLLSIAEVDDENFIENDFPIYTNCPSQSQSIEESSEQDGEDSKMIKYLRSKSVPAAYNYLNPQLQLQLQIQANKQQLNLDKLTQKSQNQKQKLQRSIDSKLTTRSSTEQDSRGQKRSDWRSSLQKHYYPESGFAWIILFSTFVTHTLCQGTLYYLSNQVYVHFSKGWLGAFSLGVSLFFSPLWISLCKRKSTRLTAVFGGLIVSLGCLFTSFAIQFHQLFISYGLIMGIGVGLTRDASSLMVGQYFKRKRELVEIIVVSGSGLGILVMSISIHTSISTFGWRLGLQAVTCALFMTFFLGTCYRSASLYHPQRRAILHLKNQKRKFKDKEKKEEKPPFLDLSCLRSKTLQILMLSTALVSFGIYSPLFFLIPEFPQEIGQNPTYLLHIYIGGSWIIGCFFSGLLVIQKNQECRISKQYLCQATSILCGISIYSLVAIQDFNGLVVFAWVYGFTMGGYNYALKIYIFERVRARHFPRAWSFVQSVQAIPIFLGVPLTGYLNTTLGFRSGYYISATTVIIGSLCLFLTDFRRKRLSRNKSQTSSLKTAETVESARSPNKSRRFSFNSIPGCGPNGNNEQAKSPVSEARLLNYNQNQDQNFDPKELTCVSEENIADLDFQDIYFEEWASEYFGANCITSCNKVENCLVSEYDPGFDLDRRTGLRRFSKPSCCPQQPPPPPGGIGASAAAIVGGMAGFMTGNSTSGGGPQLAGHNYLYIPISDIPAGSRYLGGSWSTRGQGPQGRNQIMEVIDEASV